MKGTAILFVFATAVAIVTAVDVGDARGVQSRVDALAEEMMKKVLEVELHYHNKKIPLYKERNQFLSQIKGFWPRVLENHPSHNHWVQGMDHEMLQHLTNIEVDELQEDDETHHTKNHFRVIMKFSQNPYFTDSELWRDIRHGGAADENSDVSGVNWLPDRKPQTPSFFNYFEKKTGGAEMYLDPHKISDITHVVRYEFWQNPFTYYDIPTFEEMSEEARRANEWRQDHNNEDASVEFNSREEYEEAQRRAEAAVEEARKAEEAKAAADPAQKETEPREEAVPPTAGTKKQNEAESEVKEDDGY